MLAASDTLGNFRPDSTCFQSIAGNAIVEADELDRLKATIKLLARLEEGEQSAREKGWLTADEVEAVLGL